MASKESSMDLLLYMRSQTVCWADNELSIWILNSIFIFTSMLTESEDS